MPPTIVTVRNNHIKPADYQLSKTEVVHYIDQVTDKHIRILDLTTEYNPNDLHLHIKTGIRRPLTFEEIALMQEFMGTFVHRN